MSSTDNEVIGLTTNDRVRVHVVRMLHFHGMNTLTSFLVDCSIV